MEHSDHPKQRRHGATIIALTLFLLSISGVFALTVTAPSTVQEGQDVNVQVSGAGNLAILIDGNTVQTGTGTISHTLQTDSSSAGLYSYKFTSDSPGETNQSKNVEVQNVPLTVTIESPLESELATQQVTFKVSTSWEPELCWVTIDGNSHTLIQTSPTVFSNTVTVADGVHNLEYKCKLSDEVTSQTRSLLVDTSPPVVLGTSPTGQQTGPFVTLAVDTDEIAQCRYGIQNSPNLPNLMSSTYALRNTVTLELAAQGAQTYFVRCTDVHGNTMPTSRVISFSYTLAPSAKIFVEEDEPLKAGTYELKLETNIPLAETPTLSYIFQQSGTSKTVGLTGEDDNWDGFIIIPENIEDSVISFSFSGKSEQGIVGTDITKGSLITIDAIPPPPIEDITIENSSTSITLKWFVKSSEDGTIYNIYRAEDEGVGYTDFYASTKNTRYTDLGATGSRYYYYRVAPEDEAGNIGELSAEVYGSSINRQLSEFTDPILIARLDEEILKVRTTLLDVNRSIQDLEEESNSFKIDIIRDMKLLEKSHELRKELEASLARLTAISVNPSESEVELAISETRKIIVDARHKIVSRIVPQSQAETNQLTDLEGLEHNLPYILTGKDISDSEERRYLDAAISLQEHITVKVFGASFSIWDVENMEHKYTFVKKRVSLDRPENDVTLIEVMPKAMAVHEITFEKEPESLDPVKYTFPVMNDEEYTYVVDDIVSLEEVKKTRTFLYTEPAVASSPVAATGYATKPFMPSSNTWLMLVGIVVILGLVVYYVSLSSEPIPFKGLPISTASPVNTIVRRPVSKVKRIVRKYSQVPTEQPSSTSIRQMLQQAEQMIDVKQYEQSLDNYKSVIQYLEGDDGLQQVLHEETVRVYKKLLLYKRLNDTGRAIHDKNVTAVRESLGEVRRLASEVGEQETMLISDARSTFTEFVQELNRLEIDRMAGY